MIIIKNITELVRYQQTERENKMYELFTATVSHEMRTPLNSIISLIKVVLGSNIEENVRKTLKIVYSSSQMLSY
jgi:signal transduction histidine kinase